MLESKAKYYEDVLSGKKIADEGDEEIFLVDFDKKVNDELGTKSEFEEKSENSLKIKTAVNEDEYYEKLRLKWQKEHSANLLKDTVRYQDIQFDEIRNMGVGSFKFSKEESEREKQMAFFKKIEIEAKSNQTKNEIHRLKRERAILERLNKVKQRRLLKKGFNSDQIKRLCNFEEDIVEIDKEIFELEEVVKNNDINNPQENQEKIDETDSKNDSIRKDTLKREWDKPKLKEKIWEKHIQNLRNQRKKCFAPPSMYEAANNKINVKRKYAKEKNKIKNKKMSEDHVDELKDGKKSSFKSFESQGNTNPLAFGQTNFSNNFFSMYPPPYMQPTFLAPPFFNAYLFQQNPQIFNTNPSVSENFEDNKTDTS